MRAANAVCPAFTRCACASVHALVAVCFASRACASRRALPMLRLADNFEAGIKGVVDSVASQATEMQSSAQAMTQTAEQATRQATVVAASVEEASANVQTVASSAEELSASVREIGQQVEHSSKISSQAVIE